MKDVNEPKPEIDFRDLIRKPEKLFGYSYLYFLAALVFLGVLYVWNLTVVGKNGVPAAAPADSVAMDIPLVMPAVLPPIDVMQAGVSSPAAVDRGRDLFKANCVACHGEGGKGDGPSALTLNPAPRNFTSLQGWKNGAKVSQIYKTLQEGIPGTGMASYGYLPPADRFALAHYVRTFAQGQPMDSPDDLRQLETLYQLSQGVNRPGQIPVAKAKRIVIAEGSAEVRRATALVKSLESDDADGGARLLRSVSADKERAVTALVIHGPEYPGLDAFIRTVSADPLLYGLKPAVNDLSREEWGSLFNYIASLRKQTS